MIRLACLALAAALAGGAFAQGRSFEERLREAEARLLRARRPAAKVRAPARPRRQAAARPPSRIRKARRRPAVIARRPTPRRPAAARVPRNAFTRVAGWRFQSTNLRDVRYSIRRRAAGAPGSPKTGDLVLIAEPEHVRVFFYLGGGSQVAGDTTAVVRNYPPPKKERLYVLASAPKINGRARVFVPVKRGHVTTVRFTFRGPNGRAAENPGSAPAPD